MADVFISYSKADRAIAEALSRDLGVAGFDVWWDFELYAGDDFHDMIRAEIGKAKAVIVIWSETAVASRWVRGEAAEAMHHGSLVSTHVAGFNPRGVPLNYLEIHCEPVTNRERMIRAIERKGAKRSTPPTAAKDPLADLRARVARGEAEAQYLLGNAFYFGQYGLSVDQSEAVRLYKLAAEQGHAGAQFNLAISYDQGIGGLSKDEREAVRLYQLAAEQGIAPAQFNLGVCYALGTGGLPKDEREAVRLYKLAAEQGHAGAQCHLAACYEQGTGGLSKDEREAVRLYRLAAAQGESYAIEALNRLKVPL